MRSLARKVLLSLMVIGAIGSSLAAGTFASFTATGTTASTTFSTGTLVLGNQVGAAATCLSNGSQIAVGSTTPDSGSISGTNDHQCDPLMNQPNLKKNDDIAVDVTLTNLGSLPGALTARLDGCSDTLCGFVHVSVASFASALDRQNGNVATCHFGGDCTTAPTQQTLAQLASAGTLTLDAAMAPGAVRYLRVWIRMDAGGTNGTYVSPSFIWEVAQ